MLCSGASLAAVLWAASQQDLFPEKERLDRQLATMTGGFAPTGVAVLIDAKGLFLAHASALPRGSITGTVGGREVKMEVIAEDKETGLVLLSAQLAATGAEFPVRIAASPLTKGERLVVATTEGLKRSVVSADLRAGQVRPSLRYVPLSEVKMEEGRVNLTGAVAFNLRGELVGVLSGVSQVPQFAGSQALNFGKTTDVRPDFGPGGLAVGYCYGPLLVDRVVQGFLSPDRKVRHPSIGVFFRSGTPAGALLETVMPDSPAAKAGLREGDLVVEADGLKVDGPVTFAVVLFNQKVGEALVLRVRRGVQETTVRVVVGAAS
jgi:serine protease Do